MSVGVMSLRGGWATTEATMPPPPPAPQPAVHKRTFHSSFHWGTNAEVLFPGWPGRSSGMYALALIFVFAAAVLTEWLTHCRDRVKPGGNRIAAGFLRVALHALRAGMAYLVILAVMSFNGGVFLAAVMGHAVGYSLFGSGLRVL